MLSKRWFFLRSNQVHGPYDLKEIEELSVSDGNGLIWGRGLTEWISFNKFQEYLKSESYRKESQGAIEPQWRYKYDQKEFGPMHYQELLAHLRRLPDPEKLELWSDEFNEWREIYLVAKVADELGVSRRSYPRVPIMGNLICETSRGPIEVKVISLSEGGFGASHGDSLQVGERFKAVLSSPNLFISIHCQCEVLHINKEGYTGLRFINLPTEAKGAIIEYINKFKDAQKVQH